MSRDVLAKLLSHRLRGFAAVEQTRPGVEAACRSDVAYLEMDTRVTRDGEVLVHHDSRVGPRGGARMRIAGVDAAQVSRLLPSGVEPPMTLRDALGLFARRASSRQRLCLDIKDFGFEETHLGLVRAAGVEDAVAFVSWIPQTLLRLRELGAAAPLVLSHFGLASLGWAGRMVERLLRRSALTVDPYVVLGGETASRPLGDRAHGYQHVLVCSSVPDALSDLLARTGGGVCVPRWLAGDAFLAECSARGLQAWIYSTRSASEYLRWARDERVHVVFCDAAPDVRRVLAPARAGEREGGA